MIFNDKKEMIISDEQNDAILIASTRSKFIKINDTLVNFTNISRIERQEEHLTSGDKERYINPSSLPVRQFWPKNKRLKALESIKAGFEKVFIGKEMTVNSVEMLEKINRKIEETKKSTEKQQPVITSFSDF